MLRTLFYSRNLPKTERNTVVALSDTPTSGAAAVEFHPGRAGGSGGETERGTNRMKTWETEGRRLALGHLSSQPQCIYITSLQAGQSTCQLASKPSIQIDNWPFKPASAQMNWDVERWQPRTWAVAGVCLTFIRPPQQGMVTESGNAGGVKGDAAVEGKLLQRYEINGVQR